MDWISIYSFSSKKLDRFVHKNVVFVGDAAHVVSPFGAKGANSGTEDADNLSWKLTKILRGDVEKQFLETYNAERTAAAAQNIACTGQSNTFIAPQGEAATALRNDILENTLRTLYNLTSGAAYLITPDQYILGRWKNFNPAKAIDLMNVYLSGVIYDNTTLHKTEQEVIDEEVSEKLMRFAN